MVEARGRDYGFVLTPIKLDCLSALETAGSPSRTSSMRERWFEQEVQATIDAPRTGDPHDRAMAELEKCLTGNSGDRPVRLLLGNRRA